MSYITKSLHTIFLMLLMSFSTAALANDGPSTSLVIETQSVFANEDLALAGKDIEAEARAIFNAQPSGLAARFVEQVFGRWVSDPSSSEVTLITIAAGYTNVIALILGVVILGYVMLAGIVNTAASGEVLGRNWSTVWLPLRTAMAFGLIMPLGSSTTQEGVNRFEGSSYLSMAQTSVLYMAMVGSNGADYVWGKVLEAIDLGVPPVLPARPEGTQAAVAAFTMMQCGYYRDKHLNDLGYNQGISAQEENETSLEISVSDTTSDIVTLGNSYAMRLTYEKPLTTFRTEAQTVDFSYNEMESGIAEAKRLLLANQLSNIQFGSGGSGNTANINSCGSIDLGYPYGPIDRPDFDKSDLTNYSLLSGNGRSNAAAAVVGSAKWIRNAIWDGTAEQRENIRNDVKKAQYMYLLHFMGEIIPEIEKFSKSEDEGGIDNLAAFTNAEVAKSTGKLNKNHIQVLSNYNTITTSIFQKSKELGANLRDAGVFFARAGAESEYGFNPDVADGKTPTPRGTIRDTSTREGKTRVYEAAKNAGWIGAGAVFFEMSRYADLATASVAEFQSSLSEADGSGLNDFCTNEDEGFFSTIFGWFGDDDAKDACVDSTVSDLGYIRLIDSVAKTLYNFNNSAEGVDVEAAAGIDEGLFGGFLEADNVASFLLDALGAFSGDDGLEQSGDGARNSGSAGVRDTSGVANPFLTVTAIGHGILNLVLGVLIVLGVAQLIKPMMSNLNIASRITSLPAKIVPSGIKDKLDADGAVGLASIAGGVILSFLLTTGVAAGFSLAYLIPFMPLMIWVLLVIGWIMMLIEAVISAPLAVIMMARPEGEGISGQKLERAISLIAGLILRPTLMVLGLVASMTIAYIGFSVFNLFFWSFTAAYTSSGIFDTIAVIALYTTGSLVVAKSSFQIIHQLPNNILEWMNTSNGRTFGEQNIEGVSAQAIGGATSSMGGIVTSATQKAQAQKKLNHDRQDKNDHKAGDIAAQQNTTST